MTNKKSNRVLIEYRGACAIWYDRSQGLFIVEGERGRSRRRHTSEVTRTNLQAAQTYIDKLGSVASDAVRAHVAIEIRDYGAKPPTKTWRRAEVVAVAPDRRYRIRFENTTETHVPYWSDVLLCDSAADLEELARADREVAEATERRDAMHKRLKLPENLEELTKVVAAQKRRLKNLGEETT